MNQSIIGTRQMVVSPHYLASMAGNQILQKGGNAFDAAVAVSGCLAVVYPHMTGLGGDSFWLTYRNKDKTIRAYNGSGRSGGKVTRGAFAGKSSIPFRGIESIITVPGMVDSWDAILNEYGSMTLAEVLEPAIDYAEHGFPFSEDQHFNTKINTKLLSETPITSDIYMPNGKIPEIGERFIQKDLARTLSAISEFGRDIFYKGEVAQAIVSYLQGQGGLLTEEDFASHHGEWVTPISATYRDYTMYQVPPNSQGFIGLLVLNILENYDFGKIKHGSFEYYHLLVEAIKKGIHERNQVLTDPEFFDIPLDRLLSKTFAKELASSIDVNSNEVQSPSMGSDTAYAAVVDKEGNAVSFIQSLYFEYGSGVVAGNTGIIMQNRGSFFSLDPEHVNTLEPNKRTFHTLMPAMACKDGKPRILYGTQGGEGQPQTQTAIITRMIDYGMEPQQALNEPRFVWGKTWGEETQELKIEDRVDEKSVTELKQAKHQVNIVNSFDKVMGQAQAILIDDQGFLKGGVDPRGNGASVGI
ncbi:gamma-glutamyltransferase [Terrilactibacillus laevilacticus]|uniref:Glutathione hydrolase proenzyme n=1 Tax=Terrilactibacillus laevilacticus TaxID=1380157 RepID=A0ABW5PQW6_9BACI|nr:gamma-glutamyltransferase [Terrilactibacillus laevilacticus]